jgi:tripeptide aminopeptidase
MDGQHTPTPGRRARPPAPADLGARVKRTLTALVGISSVSGQEDEVREYLRGRLTQLDLDCWIDNAGNLIASLPGTGAPLLLNAHMDRVPPGRGHVPVVADGHMRSDGSTNLGADDGAGLTIILELLEELARRALPHRPLVILFTVGEEVGLRGAAAFDPAPWNVAEGLVFDNAGQAGAIVTHGGSYVAFDAVLRGRGGHPGKDLSGTASAIDIFRRTRLPPVSLDGDTTRVSLGMLSGGTARNAIPAEVRVTGEVRTLLRGAPLLQLLASLERDFLDAAQEAGGSAQCQFEPHGSGYRIPDDEPLLQTWRRAWEGRGHVSASLTSFIGSDTNALRQRLRTITISTGVEHEHTADESIALAPLAELVEAALTVVAPAPPG